MATFGIISEGITDQITIENILIGYTGDKNSPVTPLQPKSEKDHAGWGLVFDYCDSDDFKGAFQYNDFVVIHLDTDFFRRDGLPEELRIQLMQQKEPAEIIELVKALLIQKIGTSFYSRVRHQIIFAIAVDEIECWFLSIYYSSKKAAKTENCLKTLNVELQQKEGFTIHKKELEYYRKLSKHFRRKTDLLKYSQPNISFNAFIEELNQKLTPSTEANA